MSIPSEANVLILLTNNFKLPALTMASCRPSVAGRIVLQIKLIDIFANR